METVTDGEVIKRGFISMATDLRVCFPGIVQSFDAGKQVVDVLPQINRVIPDGDGGYAFEAITQLAHVSTAFECGGGFFISFPFQKGDPVVILCSDYDLNAWLEKGEQCDPGDVGIHHIAGAFVLPASIRPVAKRLQNVDANNLVIGSDSNGSSRIVIKPGGEIDAGASATDFVAMNQKVLNELSSISTAIGTILTHTHAVSGAVASASTNIGGGYDAPDSVGSTNLKAEE